MLKHLFPSAAAAREPRPVRPSARRRCRASAGTRDGAGNRAGYAPAMAIRALVFDVFGTLVDWRSGVADAFQASGVSGDPYELADAWRARYRPILAEVNDGARPWGSFDELHLVTLDDLLSERGVELSGAARGELVGGLASPGPVAGRPRGPRGAARRARRWRCSPTATSPCSSTSPATATCASSRPLGRAGPGLQARAGGLPHRRPPARRGSPPSSCWWPPIHGTSRAPAMPA